MNLPACCARCLRHQPGQPLPCEADRPTLEWLRDVLLEGRKDCGLCPSYTLALSTDQTAALEQVKSRIEAHWEAHKAHQNGTREEAPVRPNLVLAGAAGTGKTTILLELIRTFVGKVILLAAPTGKAAARLREITGEQTRTMHGLIYLAPEDQGKCPACEVWSKELAISKLDMRKKGMTDRSCPTCNATFPLDHEIEAKLVFKDSKAIGEMAPPDLVIVDEASMVNTQLHSDFFRALHTRCAVLYVGDREQLPPVDGQWGPDFANPAGLLDQVHRQALNSPIILAATQLRKGQWARPFPAPTTELLKVFRNATPVMAAEWLVAHREQNIDATLLTYTNATRQNLNAIVRSMRGLTEAPTPLTQGDRMVSLCNNDSLGCMNGEVFVVDDAFYVMEGVLKVTLRERPTAEVYVPSEIMGQPRIEYTSFMRSVRGKWDRAIERWQKQVDPHTRKYPDGETYARQFLRLLPPDAFLHADYGECLTGHKSQGSEWPAVGLVWDRACWGMWKNAPEDARRWAYTALTRARESFAVFFI